MKGKVLGYDETTNRGKISGEDGKRYDFVRMDWKSQNTPELNTEVDYCLCNEDGLIYAYFYDEF